MTESSKIYRPSNYTLPPGITSLRDGHLRTLFEAPLSPSYFGELAILIGFFDKVFLGPFSNLSIGSAGRYFQNQLQ